MEGKEAHESREEVLGLLREFPKPPLAAPKVHGWERRVDSAAGRSTWATKSPPVSPRRAPLVGDKSAALEIPKDMELFDFFLKVALDKVETQLYRKMLPRLRSLTNEEFNLYSQSAFRHACQDESALSPRIKARDDTPKNKGLKMRIRGIFGKVSNTPTARLESMCVDFLRKEPITKSASQERIEMGRIAKTSFVVHNDGKHKFFIRPERIDEETESLKAFTFRFVPSEWAAMEGDYIIVRKRHSVEIGIELLPKQSDKEFFIFFVLQFACGFRMLFRTRAVVMPSVFGIDPSTLPRELVPSAGLIPSTLVLMRDYLMSNGGMEAEGIFRLAADEAEMATVRSALNSGTFEKCRDINCIATSIKVFFRELPSPVLSAIPKEVLMNLSSLEDAQHAVHTLSDDMAALLK